MRRNSVLPHPRLTSFLAPAASRASWIGTVNVKGLSVPVKAYATIASDSATQLCQVHQGCGRRISHCKTCSTHGAVPAERIAKAYEYSSDCLVELSKDELAQLAPVDDKTITLERFFPGDQLDLTLLAGRSLFIVPANPAAGHAFAILKTVLMQKQVWALGRTVFSHKRQLVVIQPAEDTLLLHTLHDPGTRRASVSFRENAKSPSSPETQALKKVIDAASGPFDVSTYRDDSGEILMAMIRNKLAGRANRRNKRAVTIPKVNSRKQSRQRTVAKAA